MRPGPAELDGLAALQAHRAGHGEAAAGYLIPDQARAQVPRQEDRGTRLAGPGPGGIFDVSDLGGTGALRGRLREAARGGVCDVDGLRVLRRNAAGKLEQAEPDLLARGRERRVRPGLLGDHGSLGPPDRPRRVDDVAAVPPERVEDRGAHAGDRGTGAARAG